MVLSIVATIALVLYQRHVVRRTGSIAITADELHYRGDLVVNVSVIIALVLGAILDRYTVLDLHTAFTRCYDQAGFSSKIDYSRDPSTALSDEDRRWLHEVLRQQKLR